MMIGLQNLIKQYFDGTNYKILIYVNIFFFKL